MSTEKFVERFLTSYDLGRTVVKKKQGQNNVNKILKVDSNGYLVLADDNNTEYSAGGGLQLNESTGEFSLEELTVGGKTLNNNTTVDKYGRVTGMAQVNRQLADYSITDGWENNDFSTVLDNTDLKKIWRGIRDGVYGLWVVMERESGDNT
ncbi:MAG: hypothetical protein M0R38_10845 [Bacteroidia bacterium]|nr:hypothetical protein [Bacteroidia bacterium]